MPERTQIAQDLEMTAQKWNEHASRFAGRNTGLFWWEAGPEIQKHVNSKISGDPETDWVAYTLLKYFEGKLPLGRCISLGCGNGHLERKLARFGAFHQCDAYDVAENSLEKARQLAAEAGLAHISYYGADINKIELPAGVYDSAWINNAMHHFEALEHVSKQISHSLRPEGLLILKEYIGPSRFQFPARQKEAANLCLQLLPADYRIVMQEQIDLEIERALFRKGARWFARRIVDKLRDGDLLGVIRRRFDAYKSRLSSHPIEKTTVLFPSLRDVIAADPSEAVRSVEIVEVLQKDFDIVDKTDLGGNVLQFLLARIAGHFSAEDPLSQALLRMLINIEDTLLQCGEFESDFAYIVARPKRSAV